MLEEVGNSYEFAGDAEGKLVAAKIVFVPADGKLSTRTLAIRGNPLTVPGFVIDTDKSTTTALADGRWYVVSVGINRVDEAVLYMKGEFTTSGGPATINGQWLRGF